MEKVHGYQNFVLNKLYKLYYQNLFLQLVTKYKYSYIYYFRNNSNPQIGGLSYFSFPFIKKFNFFFFSKVVKVPQIYCTFFCDKNLFLGNLSNSDLYVIIKILNYFLNAKTLKKRNEIADSPVWWYLILKFFIFYRLQYIFFFGRKKTPVI